LHSENTFTVKIKIMKRNIKLGILGMAILMMLFSVSCYPEYGTRRHNENVQQHNNRNHDDRDHRGDDHH
jgi:hypothetical protein